MQNQIKFAKPDRLNSNWLNDLSLMVIKGPIVKGVFLIGKGGITDMEG